MQKKRHAAYFLVILGVVTVVVVAAYRFLFPFGPRPCCLPVMLQALRDYAEDHNGYFPTGGRNPREALLKLYPVYLNDERFLAGLSGDRKLLKQQMSAGLEISEDASSWVYWPGFRRDDPPELAIIWERAAGVKGISSRAPRGSHAVGVVDGKTAQVSRKEWFEFLQRQEFLRRRILESRDQEQGESNIVSKGCVRCR